MINYHGLMRKAWAHYRGNQHNDMQMYLQCRERISRDFCAAHHRRLKAYYRTMFLKGAK